MIKKLKVGSIELSNNLLLAPIAGFSDAAMRLLALEAGASLVFTEMVSAKGLLYNNKNTGDLLKPARLHHAPSSVMLDDARKLCGSEMMDDARKLCGSERMCGSRVVDGSRKVCGAERVCGAEIDLRPTYRGVEGAQLFGSEAEVFREVIRNCELLAPFPVIDINMGCPVRKIAGAGDGSALLAQPKKAAAIVAAAASASTKPITVKVRIPPPLAGISLSELVKLLADSGASLVTIHGRTARMMYSGQADWDAIHRAAQNQPIPVIGNGDICSVRDARARLPLADGIMLARGAIGNPSLFRNILSSFDYPAPPHAPHLTPSSSPSPSPSTSTFSASSAPIYNIEGRTGKIAADLAGKLAGDRVGDRMDDGMGDLVGARMGDGMGDGEEGAPSVARVAEACLRHIEYSLAFYGERYTVLNMRKTLAYYVRGLSGMRAFKLAINSATNTAQLIKLVEESLALRG